jgi:hypothetical protein
MIFIAIFLTEDRVKNLNKIVLILKEPLKKNNRRSADSTSANLRRGYFTRTGF